MVLTKFFIVFQEPRVIPCFETDPLVTKYKVASDFVSGMVEDPYSYMIKELQPRSFISKNHIYVLIPHHTLTKDKLSLAASLLCSLNGLGCKVEQLSFDHEADILRRSTEIKQSNPLATIFKAQIFIQESHTSPTFGSMCYSYDLMIECFEKSKTDFPNKLSILTRNFDGSIVNQNTLVSNNMTPICLTRLYLEQISIFFKEFINAQQ